MELPGVRAHLVQRGNNRGARFFGGEDYLHYLIPLPTLSASTPP